jgi:hypothetical protein
MKKDSAEGVYQQGWHCVLCVAPYYIPRASLIDALHSTVQVPIHMDLKNTSVGGDLLFWIYIWKNIFCIYLGKLFLKRVEMKKLHPVGLVEKRV